MNKLEGLPTIHYISIEESVDRRNNFATWFNKYNTTNHVAHLFKRFEEYNYEIVGPLVHLLAEHSKGPITSHLSLLKHLYENYTDEYFFMGEDDLSLETVEYWNFTWKEFFERLPSDWKCVQLGVIREYPCNEYYLEPRRDKDWLAAAYLIKRDYIKFLLDRYYSSDIFKLDISEFNCIPVVEQILFLSPIGGIYSFPLFVEDCVNIKSTFIGDYALEDGQGYFHYNSYQSVINWWKTIGCNLSINTIMKGKINHIYQEPHFGEDWFSYPNLYKNMVERFPSDSKFVEIGSWKGKSSAFMAVEIANSHKNIDFYCVDTWEGSVEHQGREELSKLFDIFQENMAPLDEYYTSMRMTSLNAVNHFEDKSLDFIFIDASHEYEDVKKDIKAWLPKVKPGGVIAGHDYYVEGYDYFPGVKQAVNESLNVNELILMENCWMYEVKESNELVEFALDPNNGDKSYKLAKWYEKQGHTAPAHTYYLRAAERTENKELAYTALIRASFCYKNQGSRDATEKVLLENALMLLHERPEAYYFLSSLYERKQEWQNAYIYANLGLEFYSDNREPIDVPEFRGKYLLIFQKAVSAWWWGKGKESRQLFHHLVDEYWNIIDKNTQDLIEKNLNRLGSGPESQAFHTYTKEEHKKLRYKFHWSPNIIRNYSQIYQDMFILSMLNGKRNGTFLEIGGADPFLGNNTALLEKDFTWTGVSLEYDSKFIENYRNNRSAKLIQDDALTVDYRKILQENFSGNVIDYLQLDIEPARNTYECMLRIPFDDYKFAVITYEHDYYVDVTRSYRDKSREFLTSKGYVLVANDLSPDGISNFEDWWVHPELVDASILEKMTSISEGTQHAKQYILSGEEEEKITGFFNLSPKQSPTCWIVDNFYENPDEIREFALKQDYLEGGLGRGFIGRRTHQQFLFPGLKERFEEIMGRKITKWEEHGMNGRFQVAWSGEPLVYHCDSQQWGGMLYLTPNAPYQCGTTLYAHKQTKARTYYEPGYDASWRNIPGDCHLDGTPFEPVDVLGNVYNRLVIFDASCIHSASQYFGTVMDNGRLWQMFFFDAE